MPSLDLLSITLGKLLISEPQLSQLESDATILPPRDVVLIESDNVKKVASTVPGI